MALSLLRRLHKNTPLNAYTPSDVFEINNLIEKIPVYGTLNKVFEYSPLLAKHITAQIALRPRRDIKVFDEVAITLNPLRHRRTHYFLKIMSTVDKSHCTDDVFITSMAFWAHFTPHTNKGLQRMLNRGVAIDPKDGGWYCDYRYNPSVDPSSYQTCLECVEAIDTTEDITKCRIYLAYQEATK